MQKDTIAFSFLDTHDAFQVAQLHQAAFPEYFLTALGTELIKRYYKELIEYNKLSIGAFRHGRMIGFIVGGQHIEFARSRFFRKNFLFCCYRVVLAFIRSAIVRRGMLNRISHVVAALRSRMKRTGNNCSLPKHDFSLLSIAVDSQLKGKRIALHMLNKFNGILCMNRINTYRLSVMKGNERAISFYKKAGMRIEKETRECYRFRKNLDC